METVHATPVYGYSPVAMQWESARVSFSAAATATRAEAAAVQALGSAQAYARSADTIRGASAKKDYVYTSMRRLVARLQARTDTRSVNSAAKVAALKAMCNSKDEALKKTRLQLAQAMAPNVVPADSASLWEDRAKWRESATGEIQCDVFHFRKDNSMV